MKLAALATSTRAATLLTRPVKLTFSPDDVLTVQVRMTGVSDATRARVAALQKDLPTLVDADESEVDLTPAIAVFAAVISELVASWDLEDEDGNIVDTTVEAVSSLGFLELLLISTALIEEVQRAPFGSSGPSKPPKKSGKSSRKR